MDFENIANALRNDILITQGDIDEIELAVANSKTKMTALSSLINKLEKFIFKPVSYTHLTLPTSDLV